MINDENEQEVDDWVNQVHLGSCCSDSDEEPQVKINSCKSEPGVDQRVDSNEDS